MANAVLQDWRVGLPVTRHPFGDLPADIARKRELNTRRQEKEAKRKSAKHDIVERRIKWVPLDRKGS